MSHMTLDDRVYIQEGLDNNLNPNLIFSESHQQLFQGEIPWKNAIYSFESFLDNKLHEVMKLVEIKAG